MGSALIDGDPQRIGGYWLAGRLGAGGQGVVYEGYDQAGARVAIKVLRGDPVGQPELRDRLAKEAVSAQRVASFCTAKVLGADLEGPRPYVVSEYVESPSLRTLKMSLTSTGQLTGTPGYMAPEVFSGERAGPAADVFAWGAVVLYAATGRDPFTGEALGAVMHRVLSHDPDLDVLPASLRGPVRAALSKDPALRPAARELLLGLVSGDGSLNTPRLLARGADDGRRVGTAADDPALGVIAEDAYAALDPAGKELVPELFLRLVTVTDEGELALREPHRAELPAGVDRVLDAFTYLVSGTDPVRLLRPALPLAWPRLRAWIEAGAAGRARGRAHGQRAVGRFHRRLRGGAGRRPGRAAGPAADGARAAGRGRVRAGGSGADRRGVAAPPARPDLRAGLPGHALSRSTRGGAFSGSGRRGGCALSDSGGRGGALSGSDRRGGAAQPSGRSPAQQQGAQPHHRHPDGHQGRAPALLERGHRQQHHAPGGDGGADGRDPAQHGQDDRQDEQRGEEDLRPGPVDDQLDPRIALHLLHQRPHRLPVRRGEPGVQVDGQLDHVGRHAEQRDPRDRLDRHPSPATERPRQAAHGQCHEAEHQEGGQPHRVRGRPPRSRHEIAVDGTHEEPAAEQGGGPGGEGDLGETVSGVHVGHNAPHRPVRSSVNVPDFPLAPDQGRGQVK
ncbi:serine/threonine protein kinase [Nonomuraea sp. KM90]|uniref:serine/threonine protein kinase n=1 Tax=Nonomuraea sp. KM90 TaxID=3457428 RepID=UPI003FCE5F48